MKQMKFFALVLTFLMGVSLTSCIDEGESSTAAEVSLKLLITWELYILKVQME